MPEEPAARTLVVMRHSKAEDSAPTDHGRPLSERGLGDAQAAGQWLAAQGIESVLPLVSSAVRAQQTWREVSRAVGGTARVLNGLYNAGLDEVLTTVRMSDDVPTVMVVGHNPTMEAVVHEVVAPRGELYDELSGRGFPTSAIAVLRVVGGWSDLAPGESDLLAFYHR